MQARAEGHLKNGGRIEVTLEESDAETLIEGWAGMNLQKRWQALSDRADLMIVEYMLRRQEISKEYAMERISRIKGQQ